MQPHHPSFEGEAHNLVANLIFLGRFPTKVLHFFAIETPETFLYLAASNVPRLYWSAEKAKMAENKMAGVHAT